MSSRDFPRRHADTTFRSVGDEGGLVVMPAESVVQVLNPVGIKVFSLLDGQTSLDAIVSAVAAEFEVSEDEARADVKTFLDELDAKGMLERDPQEIDA